MKRLMVQVKDISRINDLDKYGRIVFVWKELNYIEMETHDNNVDKISQFENVISCSISTEGNYQSCEAVC